MAEVAGNIGGGGSGGITSLTQAASYAFGVGSLFYTHLNWNAVDLVIGNPRRRVDFAMELTDFHFLNPFDYGSIVDVVGLIPEFSPTSKPSGMYLGPGVTFYYE